MKRYAPATARNSAAIADVLADELPETGSVLEIASGSGEHALYFAREFPEMTWKPSDLDVEALDSIRAWSAESGLTNIATPIQLDASDLEWPAVEADAIFCCNMIHISPWNVTEGLMRGSKEVLGKNAPLILYGPFLEEDIKAAPSNLAFDHSLKSRNLDWGLRSIIDLDSLAEQHGLKRKRRVEMPANNLTLIYRKI